MVPGDIEEGSKWAISYQLLSCESTDYLVSNSGSYLSNDHDGRYEIAVRHGPHPDSDFC
jgi:hypothetical protein